MNTYTQESCQKYERKHSSKRKCADQYKTDRKDKKRSYSTERSLKRNWEIEA
jgi:hypothetical protein